MSDDDDQTPIDGLQVVTGACAFNKQKDSLEEFQLNEISLKTLDGASILGHGRVVFGYVNATIGRKTIPYKLRAPLPE